MRNAPGGPIGRADLTHTPNAEPADIPLAGDNRGPAALKPAVHRGPVQDESGHLDPLDDLAMRQVEGRP